MGSIYTAALILLSPLLAFYTDKKHWRIAHLGFLL